MLFRLILTFKAFKWKCVTSPLKHSNPLFQHDDHYGSLQTSFWNKRGLTLSGKQVMWFSGRGSDRSPRKSVCTLAKWGHLSSAMRCTSLAFDIAFMFDEHWDKSAIASLQSSTSIPFVPWDCTNKLISCLTLEHEYSTLLKSHSANSSIPELLHSRSNPQHLFVWDKFLTTHFKRPWNCVYLFQYKLRKDCTGPIETTSG